MDLEDEEREREREIGCIVFMEKEGAKEPVAPDGTSPGILLGFDSHVRLVKSSHGAFEKWTRDSEDDRRRLASFPQYRNNELMRWE